MSIADNLRCVRERIAQAAEAAGRDANEITLVGVTKYVGVAEAIELVEAGCADLGESRPQELWSKAGELASASGRPVNWHLIGHLQRNKLRRTLSLVTLIHSVDSERLLAAINAEWQSFTTTPNQAAPPIRVLLEVNTSNEAAKHGLKPDEIELILAAASQFPHAEICGLMTMAALAGGLEMAARNFAALRELADRFRLKERSMGMSRDFEVAIREGATIVRVGSALWQP
ncbi:MAG: YggS family pyridoxal phosphate-dependent enzyme [Pirellulales bacterium]